jgi:uncharacterized phage protein (TIGR02216 family)
MAGERTFAAGACRLAALAAQTLGWRPDEFWRATPAELALCLAPVEAAGDPPGRAWMLALMERDENGR